MYRSARDDVALRSAGVAGPGRWEPLVSSHPRLTILSAAACAVALVLAVTVPVTPVVAQDAPGGAEAPGAVEAVGVENAARVAFSASASAGVGSYLVEADGSPVALVAPSLQRRLEQVTGAGVVVGGGAGTTGAEVAAAIADLLVRGKVAFVVPANSAADNLVVGAVAGVLDAPVLITGPDSLPASTRATLAERQPRQIRVVGARPVVGDAVLAEIAQVVPAADVQRIAAAERFDLAAQLSQVGFPDASRVDTVLLVSGLDLADAPAAAALAGGSEQSVGLLATRLDGLPEPTRDELVRLAPQRVVIVGTTAEVSEDVAAEVRSLGIATERVDAPTPEQRAIDVAELLGVAAAGAVVGGVGVARAPVGPGDRATSARTTGVEGVPGGTMAEQQALAAYAARTSRPLLWGPATPTTPPALAEGLRRAAGSGVLEVVGAGEVPVAVDGLPGGQEVTLRVRAVGPDGPGPASDPVTVTTTGTGAGDDRTRTRALIDAPGAVAAVEVPVGEVVVAVEVQGASGPGYLDITAAPPPTGAVADGIVTWGGPVTAAPDGFDADVVSACVRVDRAQERRLGAAAAQHGLFAVRDGVPQRLPAAIGDDRVCAAAGDLTDTPVLVGALRVERIDGPDRAATAAAIARATAAADTSVVYVATGGDFPDALAGVPAAVRADAPVLLAYRDLLPVDTADELARLAPERVMVLGGTGAIGDEVLSAISEAAGAPAERIGGTDRFDTAALVATTVWPDGAEEVYLATGAGFADALAGGPVAGAREAPLLLTATDALPDSTRDALGALDPDRVVILGGGAAVTQDIADAVTELTGAEVIRRSGADRFETAAALATDLPDAAVAHVATGLDFPDALAGGAAAGRLGSPVLLALPDNLPAATETSLGSDGLRRAVLLGGSAALDDAVRLAVDGALPR